MLIDLAIVITPVLVLALVVSARRRGRNVDDYAGLHGTGAAPPFGDSSEVAD
ncbi:MAG TPA: hypothetical protein VFE36_02675 [Candidatus Baltobacteraceae bacterium]|nr:hypothetical protein [Candidatus Baltobacteraceae bacterium]